MPEIPSAGSIRAPNPWPLVLCLIGVDYFSTLAYLPSIAVQAAGAFAPIAAGAVVLVTFCLALPIYWYIVAHSPDGRGAIGLLEKLIPGWRGKIVALTLLGFAAADFVITRSLSFADATVHLLNNPHGQWLLNRVPSGLFNESDPFWPPVEYVLRRITEPQVAITLILSVISFALWQLVKHGVSHRVLYLTASAVCCYLVLTAIVIVSALVYTIQHSGIWEAWLDEVFITQAPAVEDVVQSGRAWPWAWLSVILWSFPQMALGLSGFEMIMTIVPQVGPEDVKQVEGIPSRVRNTRKLMLFAVSIMAVYLVSAVVVTTLVVPRAALMPDGVAEHRALAYLAHGSTLADGVSGTAVNPVFGHRFGDLFDLSTVIILGLAGATVSMGLQNLVPHFLHRLGMEVSWAGKVGAILLLLDIIVLLVTVVFRASPSAQQWAYATSVLVLLGGTAFAVAKDLGQVTKYGPKRWLLMILSASALGFFAVMTCLTVLINYSGVLIALSFVVAILVSSFVSRWIRSTELRFEGFDFANEATRQRWGELCQSGVKVLIPHRPGLTSLAEKSRALHQDYHLNPTTPLIFIEAVLGDPSNFYQKPLMTIENERGLEVIRVCHCVSVSHVLAAICIEICRDGGNPPEIIFGWSNEPPLAANLNFLLLGEGNIPWMVKELVRKAMPEAAAQPRIRIG